MKKLLISLTAVTMALSCVACGGDTQQTASTQNTPTPTATIDTEGYSVVQLMEKSIDETDREKQIAYARAVCTASEIEPKILSTGALEDLKKRQDEIDIMVDALDSKTDADSLHKKADLLKEYMNNSALIFYNDMVQNPESLLSSTTAPSTPAPTTALTAAPAEKEFIRENYGYVSYNDLARNPDDYTGKSLTYSGKVIQVIEDDESVQHRIAVNGDYDTVIFVEYPKNMVASRILDDDWVNIYGRFVGLITYEATSGASITIPGIYLDRIELK